MFQTIFKLSDTAVSALLVFFATFLQTMNQTLQVIPNYFISKLPRNVHSARILASKTTPNADTKSFIQYVCCPTCHSLYLRDECIINCSNGVLQSKKCCFQLFPSHP